MKHHKAFWLVDEPGIETTDFDDKIPTIQKNEEDNIIGHVLKKTELNNKLWNAIMLNQTS